MHARTCYAESAHEEIQRALDIDPHSSLGLALEGIVRFQDRDYTKASYAFQRSIYEDLTLGTANLGLGIVFRPKLASERL